MKELRLANDVHGTACTIDAQERTGDAILVLSEWQVKAVWRSLCGDLGCDCGCVQHAHGTDGTLYSVRIDRHGAMFTPKGDSKKMRELAARVAVEEERVRLAKAVLDKALTALVNVKGQYAKALESSKAEELTDRRTA